MSHPVSHQTPLLRDGYGIIPRKLMRTEGLSAMAKALYAYLVSFAGDSAQAFPKQETMCIELGVSENTLRKYINELQDARAISVQKLEPHKKFSKRNKYLILDLSNLSIEPSKYEGKIPAKSEGDYNSNPVINNQQTTGTRKTAGAKETPEIKEARAAVDEHWLKLFSEYWRVRGHEERYSISAADRVVERTKKILHDKTVDEIKRRMNNWFSVSDKDRCYYPLTLVAFYNGIQKPQIIQPTLAQPSEQDMETAYLADERMRREADHG